MSNTVTNRVEEPLELDGALLTARNGSAFGHRGGPSAVIKTRRRRTMLHRHPSTGARSAMLAAQSILDCLPAGVVVLNSSDVITWANGAFMSLVQRTPDRVVGTTLHDLFAAEEVLRMVGLDHLLDEGAIDTTVILTRGESGSITVSLRGLRIEEDGTWQTVMLVTSNEEVHEHLAESTRWAAMEKERAVELARARDELATAYEQLRTTQTELVRVSRLAGMAEIASGVLHNVGNVLNSVNVSAQVVRERISQTRLPQLSRAATELLERANTREDKNAREQKLASYVNLAASRLVNDRDEIMAELQYLETQIDHIKTVVASQQQYATGSGGLSEVMRLNDVVDEAVALQRQSLKESSVEIVREYADLTEFPFDRHRTIEILINLLRNARQAIETHDGDQRQITIRTGLNDDGYAFVQVTDTGMGIDQANLDRIFSHGFTTTAGGHGFGLHRSVLMAQEAGGGLFASSDGPGTGAQFTLHVKYEPLSERLQAV